MSPSNAIWVLLLAPPLCAAAYAAFALRRLREPLLVVPPLVLLALVWRHILVAPPNPWSGSGAGSAEETAAANFVPLVIEVLINCFAAATSILLVRLVHERGRAEQVQWEGLESLRKLVDGLARGNGRGGSPGNTRRDGLGGFLELGCERFAADAGLCLLIEYGTASGTGSGSAHERRWQLLAHHDASARRPHEGSLADALAAAGTAAFEQTPVSRLMAADGPLALDRLVTTRSQDRAIPAALQCDSFIGCAVALDDGRHLALAFFVRDARDRRFTAFDKSLAQLLTAWAAERVTLTRPAADTTPAATAPLADLGALRAAPTGDPALVAPEQVPEQDEVVAATAEEIPSSLSTQWRSVPIEATKLPMDDALETIARHLEDAGTESASKGAEAGLAPIEWKLGTRPLAIALQTRSLDPLVRSLVAHARAAGDQPSSVLIKSAPLASPDGDTPGFALLEVEARGVRLSAEELSSLHSGHAPVPRARPGAPRTLSLRRLVRLLKDAGGDLSIESNDSGEAPLLRFIAYLPVSDETESRAPGPPRAVSHSAP